MDINAEFRKLFKFLIEQYQLSPEIAQKLLQKILQILSEDTGENDYILTDAESEAIDR